ncbi:MAG: hypothetical protein AAGA80_22170 [Cyanobacteria bacterium P01_F01_bin.143]
MNQADVPKIAMTELNYDLAVAQAIALIKSYSFDTNGNPAEKLVQRWLYNYQGNWVRLAAIEALYLGRYKSISIEQIMAVWLRIGTPNIHFKGEFERLICRKLPKHLVVADSFWFETDVDSFKENSNTDYLQYSQYNNLLTSKSSTQAELDFSNRNNPKSKALSDVKKILKPESNKTGDGYHLPYQSTTITNFNPILDNSSFFAKLKSLALADLTIN